MKGKRGRRDNSKTVEVDRRGIAVAYRRRVFVAHDIPRGKARGNIDTARRRHGVASTDGRMDSEESGGSARGYV